MKKPRCAVNLRGEHFWKGVKKKKKKSAPQPFNQTCNSQESLTGGWRFTLHLSAVFRWYLTTWRQTEEEEEVEETQQSAQLRPLSAHVLIAAHPAGTSFQKQIGLRADLQSSEASEQRYGSELHTWRPRRTILRLGNVLRPGNSTNPRQVWSNVFSKSWSYPSTQAVKMNFWRYFKKSSSISTTHRRPALGTDPLPVTRPCAR